MDAAMILEFVQNLFAAANVWQIAIPAIVTYATVWSWLIFTQSEKLPEVQDPALGEVLFLKTGLSILVLFVALFFGGMLALPGGGEDPNAHLYFVEMWKIYGVMLATFFPVAYSLIGLNKVRQWSVDRARAGYRLIDEGLRHSDNGVMRRARRYVRELYDAMPEEGWDTERDMVNTMINVVIPDLLNRRRQLQVDIAYAQRDRQRYGTPEEHTALYDRLKRTLANEEQLKKLLLHNEEEIESALLLLDHAEAEIRLLSHTNDSREWLHEQFERFIGDIAETAKAIDEAEREEAELRAEADAEIAKLEEARSKVDAKLDAARRRAKQKAPEGGS